MADPSRDRRDKGVLLCEFCRHTMPLVLEDVCRCCGKSLPNTPAGERVCARCLEKPPAFAMACASWVYTDGVQTAVRQFKYHRHWRLGAFFAEGMAHAARRSLPVEAVDLVTAVPSYWLKQYLRGYFPVGELAKQVAKELAKPYQPKALAQTRWTATQTRLNTQARLRNVWDAFKAEPRLVAQKAVLVIDDVLTSGATADACALALIRADAKRVFFLTAARTMLS